MVWCPDTGGVYCLPVALATGSVVTLRVEEPRNGRRTGVRWARDHTLDVALPAALHALR
jgi:hypothetical protein